MEDEKMEELRKLPLNFVRETSFSPLKINNVPQALRNSTTERVMQNSDITDARVKFTIREAQIEKRKSRAMINHSSDLIMKGAKLFNTGGGKLLKRGPIVTVPFQLHTNQRAM